MSQLDMFPQPEKRALCCNCGWFSMIHADHIEDKGSCRQHGKVVDVSETCPFWKARKDKQ